MMKKTQDTVKSVIMKTIVSKSVKAAVQNVNSACVWILNQPEPPKELKKFRKF
ncbi:cyclic lactone autoinducer peptide [Ruminococcus flavefaciens]|uniref:cyclic lactone autoinducer peptide n=1 Tax=Ruminococcus flavefaciens TaxID=1265 RepID=UPI0026EAC5A8|nr:cyclic lactone autoinducer peptide [Ruminococcus flavefaciens]